MIRPPEKRRAIPYFSLEPFTGEQVLQIAAAVSIDGNAPFSLKDMQNWYFRGYLERERKGARTYSLTELVQSLLLADFKDVLGLGNASRLIRGTVGTEVWGNPGWFYTIYANLCDAVSSGWIVEADKVTLESLSGMIRTVMFNQSEGLSRVFDEVDATLEKGVAEFLEQAVPQLDAATRASLVDTTREAARELSHVLSIMVGVAQMDFQRKMIDFWLADGAPY